MSDVIIGVGLGISMVVLLGLFELLNSKKSDRFLLKWPPISDDEFVERCPPGVNREVALKVRRIVSKQLGIPYERVHPEQNFIKDLDCC